MSPQFSDAVFQDMLEPSVERYNVPSSVLVELGRMVKFKPTDWRQII